nr:restriction endonuclease subunit S [uncultured Ruminococcus sp.]
MEGVSLKPYYLVQPDDFAYVTVTSRNGEKITLAHNTTDKTYIVSSSYIVFRVNRTDLLLSDYLFMYFNRPEFDRYSRFNSWGSARETFSWEDMCDMDIELPSIEIQQKYVDVYNAMLANQQSYERGLDDLKLTCDAYIEDLRRRMPCERIGKYIEPTDTTNVDLQYGINDVRGISIEKKLIETKADMEGINLSPYLLIQPNEFSYVTVTSRNGGKISIALNDSNKTYICSSSYVVFKSKDMEELLPQYLMLFFSRAGFDRYARFHSWGSARETFDWDNMCDVKIPIPDITIQKSIAEMYTVYNTRKRINERLKTQIKDICPILIKGSLEEN